MSVLELSTRIQTRALALDPVKVLLFVLMLPVFVLGFGLRFAWLVVAFAIAAGQDGWAVAEEQMRKRKQSPQ